MSDAPKMGPELRAKFLEGVAACLPLATAAALCGLSDEQLAAYLAVDDELVAECLKIERELEARLLATVRKAAAADPGARWWLRQHGYAERRP
jgi:hypothetical protein